jgi:hypothetical protein
MYSFRCEPKVMQWNFLCIESLHGADKSSFSVSSYIQQIKTGDLCAVSLHMNEDCLSSVNFFEHEKR